MGRATVDRFSKHKKFDISIHALRGEGDHSFCLQIRGHQDFNPRPPWGGRLPTAWQLAVVVLFQSTPSVGRATIWIFPLLILMLRISIHALRGEGDACAALRKLFRRKQFQSTPSVGRATSVIDIPGMPDGMISIHALRGEGDQTSEQC